MRDEGSFRDPSGFVFYENGNVYRSVNILYKKNFDHLINSGLYLELIQKNLLIKHSEIKDTNNRPSEYKKLLVEKIPFISYPYEWSFNQFKDALLLTLKIQKISVQYGMTLKDATPYNIQFKDNKPIFIDTLSFELIKQENYVWKPYKQFCEMFLGPICLMKHVDHSLNKLLINYINGIPLSLINKLLPVKSKFNLTIYSHIVLHNLIKENFSSNSGKGVKESSLSKNKHLNIIDQLEDYVTALKAPKANTEWDTYNKETLYEKEGYVLDKEKTVLSFIKREKYDLCWDIGSNDGFFSYLISKNNTKNLISFDIDWRCVDRNYLTCKEKNINNVFPIILDLSNPSPAIGWLNLERSSTFERFGSPDLICCFAIMHHIINSGIPFDKFIDFLSISKKDVLLEFIPLSDPKCKIIFESRDEDFQYPSLEQFKNSVSERFKILSTHELEKTKRILFHLRNIEK
ncbi:MAG: hypothetical protein VW741_01560 [Flammeovirgaceae bacterium]